MEKLIVTLTVSELRSIIQETLDRKLKMTLQRPEEALKSEENLPELITRKEVARLFKVSLVSIDKWRKFGLLPKTIKQSGRTYFLRKEVMKFLRNKMTNDKQNIL